MVVRSALDVLEIETSPRQKSTFAWLCAERAAGVWRVGGVRLGDLIQEALAATGARHGASTIVVSDGEMRIMHEALLGELHLDSDFGKLHASRVHAVSAVAHALAAAIMQDDEEAMLQESVQSAQAEFSMVKGAYYRLKGSYVGVYDHWSIIRQIQWQSDDLLSLASGTVAIEWLSSRAVERGTLLADEISSDRLI